MRKYVGLILSLIFLTGSGCGTIHLIVKPDIKSQNKVMFNVIGAQKITHGRLIRVTMSIENITDEPQPFTPSQAYLVTKERRVIYSGIPQKHGYRELTPITVTKSAGSASAYVTGSSPGYIQGSMSETSVSGPSVAEQIATLIQNAQAQEWNERIEESLIPTYIPPRTIIQGHLWFKYTKMQMIRDDPNAVNDEYYVLPIPLTMHLITPEGDNTFTLIPKDDRKIIESGRRGN